MIYVIWEDWDSSHINEFGDGDKHLIEDWIEKIAVLEEKGENGTKMLKVISGNEVSYKVAKSVRRVTLTL